MLFDEPVGGGAARFGALMRSQGSYQTLRRSGLTDDELGVAEFDEAVALALAGHESLSFSWRVRLG
ncbi:MAG: hypothetical protein ACEQSN_13800, partial [Yersinia sp. (in: enterobacteria)]